MIFVLVAIVPSPFTRVFPLPHLDCGYSYFVNWVCFIDAALGVASGSSDGTVKLWKMPASVRAMLPSAASPAASTGAASVVAPPSTAASAGSVLGTAVQPTAGAAGVGAGGALSTSARLKAASGAPPPRPPRLDSLSVLTGG